MLVTAMKNERKVIAIHINSTFTARDFLCGTFPRYANEDDSCQFVIVSTDFKHADHIRKLGVPNISHTHILSPEQYGWDRVRDLDLKRLYRPIKSRFAQLNDLPHHAIHRRMSPELQEQYVQFYLFQGGVRAGRPFPRSRMLYNLLFRVRQRSAYYFDEYLYCFLKRLAPDLLFLTRVHQHESLYFLKAADLLGIPCVGYVASWDHPTTHGPIDEGFTRLAVASKQLKREMVQLEGFSDERILVSGKIQMDHFVDPNALSSRKEFFETLGLPESCRLVTLGTNAATLKRHEPSIASCLSAEICGGGLESTCLYIRCHPFDDSWREDFGRLENRPRVVVERCKLDDAERVDEDQKLLANLMRHSDVVVQTRGSIALDAIAFDTPVISLGFDGDFKVAESDSIKNLYGYAHYKPIMESQATWFVESYAELLTALRTYLAQPGRHREGREVIRREFIEPLDGLAGKRIHEWLCTCVTDRREPETPRLKARRRRLQRRINRASLAPLSHLVLYQHWYEEQTNVSVKLDEMLSKNRREEKEFLATLINLRIRATLRKTRRVCLFGAGKHTRWLLDALDEDLRSQIPLIADDDPGVGQSIEGIRVVRADQLKNENIEAVILSTDTHQELFKGRCRELLGGKTQLVDLYEGLPSGSCAKGENNDA